ncbi:MAG: PAS domain S-box protein [Desulfovibrionaceae bacterium]
MRKAKDATSDLQALLDAFGDAVFALDKAGLVLAANVGAHALLGLSPGRLSRRSLADVAGPDAASGFAAALEELRAGGGGRYEADFLPPGGEPVPVAVRVSLARLPGLGEAALAVARDQTARRAAENLTRERMGYLTDLFRRFPFGLFIKRAADDFVYEEWSPRMEELTGLPREAVVGRTDFDIFPAEHAAYYRAMDRRAVETGEVVDVAVQEIPSDKGGIKAHVVKLPLRDPSGRISALLGITEDVTGRFETEERIRLATRDLERRVEERTAELERAHDRIMVAETHYRTLYEQAGEAILVFDGSGRLQEANPAASTIFGYSEEEFRGLDPIGLLHPEESPTVKQALETVREGRGVSVELRLRRKNNTWADVEMRVKSMAGGRVLATLWDISERKRMERELREAKEAAETASAAKSEFLANMSHEVRTPMGGIIGMTDLVLSTDLQPAQRERINAIRSASLSLLDIINDILDFSKIEAKKLELKSEPFDLRMRLDGLRDTFAIEARRKGLLLELNVADEVPATVRGDAGRLGQVLANLLSNAVKFTDEGRVVLEVRLRNQESSRVALEFAVSDTGVGISVAERDRLFEVFSQLDPTLTKRQQGTGLGLAISQRLVKMMEGAGIELESEPGRGSRFFFVIPLERVAELRRTATPGGAACSSGVAGARILLAEDNLLNQEFLTHFLREAGAEVDVAENGRLALEMLAAKRYDLVLMDVQMPEMDGLAATQLLRGHDGSAFDPDIPVVALTAYAMKGDRERMLAAGMNEYLSKPVKMDELFALVGRIMSGVRTANGPPAAGVG